MVAAALIAPWAMAPAHADGVGSVTTMTGPGSPLDGMYLTYVGCDTIGGAASAPATRINRGPDAAPLGRRSFGLVPSGSGTGSAQAASHGEPGGVEIDDA